MAYVVVVLLLLFLYREMNQALRPLAETNLRISYVGMVPVEL